MAFTPYDEQNPNPETANSYIDVAYADEYFQDRGNASWADADTATKQQALIKASDYIGLRWGNNLKGFVEDCGASLVFPRKCLYVNCCEITGIPEKIKKATCEYALKGLSGDIAPDPVQDDTGQVVSGRTEKVGSLEESVDYAVSSGQEPKTFKKYPVADSYMKPFLAARGGRTIH